MWVKILPKAEIFKCTRINLGGLSLKPPWKLAVQATEALRKCVMSKNVCILSCWGDGFCAVIATPNPRAVGGILYLIHATITPKPLQVVIHKSLTTLCSRRHRQCRKINHELGS